MSGFLVAPPKQARVSKETRKDYAEQPNRASYSGPLVPGPGFSKAGKELDHSITVSRNTNLSTLSSLVASRTALAGDDKQKSGPLVSESAIQASRFSGPIREMDPMRKQDCRSHMRTNIDSRSREDGNASTKEPALVSSHGNLSLSFASNLPWRYVVMVSFGDLESNSVLALTCHKVIITRGCCGGNCILVSVFFSIMFVATSH